MADPDYEFIEGFDKYSHQQTATITEADARAGDWLSGSTGLTIRPGVYGGSLLRIPQLASLTHDAPALYERVVGGIFYRASQLISPFLTVLQLRDAVSTVQCTLGFNGSGFAELRRGSDTGTILQTAVTNAISALTTCIISWDITVKSTGGAAKVWINGALVIDVSGVDTANAAGDGCKRFTLNAFTAAYAEFDHLYVRFYLVSGGSELPLLPGHIVDTSFPVADLSAGFSRSPITLLGSVERITTSGISAAANTIYLRRLFVETAGDLTAVYIYNTGSAGALAVRAAVYSDDNGVPGSLLAQSNSVTSITTNPQEYALLTPVALSAGSWVWIGFHNQTTSPQLYYGSANTGVSLARTYASGLPDPMPAVTQGAVAWTVAGKIENAADNFAAISGGPVGWPYTAPIESNKSATVGASDNFIFGELIRESATIHGVVVKALLSRSNTDPRTVDLTTTVGATTDEGSNPGFTPPTTAAWVATRLPLNPDTGLPWEGVLAGVQHGYRNAT